MGKGKILRAKGESIELELEEGKETFKLMPLTNEQLLEIQDIAGDSMKKDEKEQSVAAMESLILLAVHSLNNGMSNPSEDDKFTVNQMKKSSTPILIDLFEKATKINKLEKMFDFQQQSPGSGHPTLNPSLPGSTTNTFEELRKNPSQRIG